MDVPVDAPQHCPGTESEDAGKASACAGCPNQNICATGPKGPDPDIKVIANHLAHVKNKILVLSGKGGVGKTTVTATLAWALSDDDKRNIGVLDVDICGPSLPKMFGLEGESVHQSGSGWSPVYASESIAVMSIGFLLESPDDAVIWRGPKKNGMIKQFLRDVDWADLEYLLIDTPPGTSDEHLSITQYLASAAINGAVVVTTPQQVAINDVRKEISFCKKVKIPIIGVIENMSGFICPKCKSDWEVFPATNGGAEKMCQELDLKFLGRIPLDPRLGRCCDEGKNFLSEFPEAPASKAYKNIVDKIINQCNTSS